MEETVDARVFDLAAQTLNRDRETIDPDADLFDGFGAASHVIRESFLERLPSLAKAPVPLFDLLDIRTVRQASALVRRYMDDPQREYQRCLDRLDASIRRNPRHSHAYRYRAGVWSLLGKTEHVIKDLETCLKLNPEDDVASRWLRTLRRDQGLEEKPWGRVWIMTVWAVGIIGLIAVVKAVRAGPLFTMLIVLGGGTAIVLFAMVLPGWLTKRLAPKAGERRAWLFPPGWPQAPVPPEPEKLPMELAAPRLEEKDMDPELRGVITALAAKALRVDVRDVDLDADLDPGDEDAIEEYCAPFMEGFFKLANIRIPPWEFLGVFTPRRAIDLIQRYNKNPQWEYKRCLREINKELEQDPDDFYLYKHRHAVREYLGDTEGALHDLDSCMELDPWEADILALREAARLEAGDKRGAARDAWKLRLHYYALPYIIPPAILITCIAVFGNMEILEMVLTGLLILSGNYRIMQHAHAEHLRRIRARRREQRRNIRDG